MELVDCLILDDLIDAPLDEKESNPTLVALSAKAQVPVERASKLWKKAGELASEKFDTESKDWWAYKIGIFKRMLGVAESVHFVCDLEEAVPEEAARRVLDPGKHVMINNIWWRIAKRSIEDNEVTLEVSTFAVKDGVKYEKKTMKFSSLVAAVNKGKIGAKIDGKQYGPTQDPKKRDALRRKHGKGAAPGMGDYREKIEQKSEDTIAIAHGATILEGASTWGGGPEGTETAAALKALSDFPEKADDGKAFVVRWADGRAVTAFKTKKALLAWAEKTHRSLMDTEDLPIAIVSVRHMEPKIGGKKVTVHESLTGAEALASMAYDGDTDYVLWTFNEAVTAALEQCLPYAVAESYGLVAVEASALSGGVYRGRIIEGAAHAFLARYGTPVGKTEKDRVSWIASKTGLSFDPVFEARSTAHSRGLSHIDADLFAMKFAMRSILEGDDFLDEVASREEALMQFVMKTDKKVDQFETWLRSEYPELAAAPEPLHESVPEQLFNVPAVLVEDGTGSIDYSELVRMATQDTNTGKWAKQTAARVRGPKVASRQINWDRVAEAAERFRVPDAVRAMARKGLMLQKQHGVPMREADRRTARELTRVMVPIRTIQRVAARPVTTVQETDEKGVPTGPYVAQLLRGGSVGHRWARTILTTVSK